ncbi:hypothetical protein [Prescottella agglutinans]|nr:hypothetical protein [Prescottella agglutinans]
MTCPFVLVTAGCLEGQVLRTENEVLSATPVKDSAALKVKLESD